MQLYRLLIPTPRQHPGWEEHLFQAAPDVDWTALYAGVEPQPPRGQAYDTEQRAKHAEWKRRMWAWLLKSGITEIKPKDF